MKRLGLVAMTSMMMMACGGGAKSGGKPDVKNKKGLTQKPTTAKSMGKVTAKVTPPKAPASAPKISTQQAGDDGDEEYTWQEDVNEDGTAEDVVEVVDDETGDLVFATEWNDACEDGSPLAAAVFILQHADGSGSYLIASDDLCGAGPTLYGCDYDTSGKDTVCGLCTVPADGTDFTCEDTSPPSE